MGYVGKTYRIACSQAGLFYSPNTDLISADALVHPSRNINLGPDGIRKRGGSSHVNISALAGTPRLMGIHQYRKFSGSEYILMATADGKLYRDETNTIQTGLVIDEPVSMVTYNNLALISKPGNLPQVWNGSGNTTNMTLIPTDWTPGNCPSQMVIHGRGASERVWAFACPGLPQYLYVSTPNTGGVSQPDFSDANVKLIPISTGDGFGIVAGAEYGDRLFAFGKQKAFIVEDTSYDTTYWGYTPAQWEGGVAHHRLLVKTPNDLQAMTEEGIIYSINAVQQYGDYKAAALTTAANIDRWIREKIDLTRIANFHGVYDPTLRAVKWFMVRKGMTEIDTALVYFIDRPADKAWIIHDNQNFVSGYSASCSAPVRVQAGEWAIYTGDYDGEVWILEDRDKNDNGNAFTALLRKPQMVFENPRTVKDFKRGRIVTKPEGNFNLTINWWVDGVAQEQKTVSLAGSGSSILPAILPFILGGQDILELEFVLGAKGERMELEIYNAGADEDFFISELLFDVKPLGVTPK